MVYACGGKGGTSGIFDRFVESVDPPRRFWSLRRVRLSRLIRGMASDALRLRCRWIKGTVEPPLATVSERETDRDKELEESDRDKRVSK